MQRLRTRLRAGASTFPSATFLLNFLTGGLDPAVTFTRGSNATLVNSTGKITYAPANLLSYSQEFDNASWTKTATTVTANATTAPDGTTTADKLIETTAVSTQHFARTTAATLNITYAFSAYIKAAERTRAVIAMSDLSTGDASIGINLLTGATFASGLAVGSWTNIAAAVVALGNGWYRVSITATRNGSGSSTATTIYTDNGTSITYTGDGTSGIYVWGAQLEAVTYQTTPSTYVATTASAYYGPRFDYDPVTLAAKGLLIEEQRTNLLLRSEEFNNGIWQKFDGTVTANTTVAPDGTSTADTLVENTANAAHFLAVVPNTSAGSHTLSVFYKIPSARKLALYHSGTNTGRQFDASGNQSAGLFIAPAGGATVTSFGNGWYRATITVTTTAAAQEFRLWMVRASDDAISYAGDGTSGIFIWGAQLEAGAFATSYIPTVASQVTRSADVATMTGTNFSSWYNQSEGTFVAEWSTPNPVPNKRVIGTASSFDIAPLALSSTNAMASWSGSANLVTAAGPNNGGPVKAALGYSGAGRSLVYAGGATATDANTMPAINAINFGKGFDATQYLNGYIRQIAYYNTRLPNATLQALTA